MASVGYQGLRFVVAVTEPNNRSVILYLVHVLGYMYCMYPVGINVHIEGRTLCTQVHIGTAYCTNVIIPGKVIRVNHRHKVPYIKRSSNNTYLI